MTVSSPASHHHPRPGDITSDQLVVTVDRLPGLDLVAPAGELDLLTAPRLRSVLVDPVLCAQPVLALDLSALAFLDSTGLSTLIEAQRWTRARGAGLVLVVLPGTVVARVLAVAGLDAVFTIVTTRSEALERADLSAA